MSSIEAIRKQADELFSKWDLFNNGYKEKATELYVKAAVQCKIAKRWNEAGQLYEKAGLIYRNNLKDNHQYVECCQQAAKAYKNESPTDTLRCLNICITHLVEENSFNQIGTYYNEIGEIYEKENKLEEAIKAYENAEKYYRSCDREMQANKIILKIAHMHASMNKFNLAYDLFEQIISKSADDKVGSYTICENILKAGLCKIAYVAKDFKADDDINDMVNKYKNLYSRFDGSKECKLLGNIIKACCDGDIEEFTNAVFNYDKVYRLDNWLSSILLHIKKTIKKTIEEPDLDPEMNKKKPAPKSQEPDLQ